jgi:hypothetical protein
MARSYLLRDIDAGMWKRVRTRATSEGRNLRFLILHLLALYAQYGLEAIETAIREQLES